MATNTRVTLDQIKGDPRQAQQRLLATFRRQVTEAGVLREYREHATFESESRKRRRKRSQAAFRNAKDLTTDR